MNDEHHAWLTLTLGPTAITREDAESAYARLGNVRDVALEYARDQAASLRAAPLSVTIPGVVSITQTENLKAWERLIARLEDMPPDPTSPLAPDASDGETLSLVTLTSSWGRDERRHRAAVARFWE